MALFALAALWISTTAAAFALLVAVEVALYDRSRTLLALRNISSGSLPLLLLRPFSSTSRATLTLSCLILSLAFLSAAVAFSGSPPTDPERRIFLTTWAVQWGGPVFASLAMLCALVVGVEDRGVSSVSTTARRFCTFLGLTALVSAAIARGADTPSLAMALAGVYAIPMYASLYVYRHRAKYRSKAIHDLGALDLGSAPSRLLWAMARSGIVPFAYPLSLALRPWLRSKDGYKISVLVAYYTGRYERARKLCDEGILWGKQRGAPSEVLVSYDLLLRARLGDRGTAITEFRNATSRNKVNSYLRANLAYLYLCDGQLELATDTAADALRLSHGEGCFPTLSQLGLALCEKAAASYGQTGILCEHTVYRAMAAVLRAHRMTESDLAPRWGATTGDLVHALGFACILLAETKAAQADREDLLVVAARCFTRSVWKESHEGARFRIALFHMVASPHYDSAEYQLSRVLWGLHNRSPKREPTYFQRMVRRNLERIAAAREIEATLNFGILAGHATIELLPPHMLCRGVEEFRVLRGKRNALLKANVLRILEDPFSQLPKWVLELSDIDPLVSLGNGASQPYDVGANPKDLHGTS